jgi:hypothetical protein
VDILKALGTDNAKTVFDSLEASIGFEWISGIVNNNLATFFKRRAIYSCGCSSGDPLKIEFASLYDEGKRLEGKLCAHDLVKKIKWN